MLVRVEGTGPLAGMAEKGEAEVVRGLRIAREDLPGVPLRISTASDRQREGPRSGLRDAALGLQIHRKR